MIDQCLNCTRKHVAHAGVLITEAVMGYPENADHAIGQLAAAEDHTIISWPHIAHFIRKHRLEYEAALEAEDTYWPPIQEILNLIRDTKADEAAVAGKTDHGSGVDNARRT